MRPRFLIVSTLGVLLATGLNPSPGVAQKPDGRLVGAVVDRSTSAPIGAATVVFLGDGRAITTDSAGTFRFDRLPVGILRFLVRAPGFTSFGLVVAIGKGEVLERQVLLDSTTITAAVATAPPTATAAGATRAQALPMVSVEAAPSLGPRFASFERRRKTGGGQYLVAADIERMGFSTLQDVARGLRGVSVECGGSNGCQIRMVRAPMRCPPEYIVDDNVDNMFGPTVPVRDIEALEVYTGPADVPGEYAGRNAGCGVIVIWTRSGPPARKKK